MKAKNSNRTRIIGLRLTPAEYTEIEGKWQASTCRKLSDYARRMLFGKPIVTTFRNASQDDLMAELSRLRSELNGIGNNLNQATRRLHTLNQIGEFTGWVMTYKAQIVAIENKLNEINVNTKKLLEIWLQ